MHKLRQPKAKPKKPARGGRKPRAKKEVKGKSSPRRAPAPRRVGGKQPAGVFALHAHPRRKLVPSPVGFRSAPPPRARELVAPLGAAMAPPSAWTAAVIPPGDNRQEVSQPTALPWCAHVRLIAVRPGGDSEDRLIGTGWLVDEVTIVTAGHCVYENGWMKQIQVLPAGDSTDFPTVFAVHCDAPSAWTNASTPDDLRQRSDLGIVKLGAPIPGVAGVLPYRVLSDDELRQIAQERVSVAGFPEIPYGEFLVDRGRLLQFNDPYLFYDVETSRGQSGGPVLYWETDRSPVVIGVHHFNVRSGASQINRAIRLGPSASAWIQQAMG